MYPHYHSFLRGFKNTHTKYTNIGFKTNFKYENDKLNTAMENVQGIYGILLETVSLDPQVSSLRSPDKFFQVFFLTQILFASINKPFSSAAS